MLVSLKNINKIYGGERIVKDICLTVEDQDRIGLIGVNGCGKSTLLRMIAGIEQPDIITRPEDETISMASGITIGFLQQDSGLNKSHTIMEEMESAIGELLAMQNELRRLEELMGSMDHDSEEYLLHAEEYAAKANYFEAREGYNIPVRIRTVLTGMGFPPQRDDTIVAKLSGGEKTRLALCKLLLEEPSLLILDEPTNHLDFSTILWLEDYLKSWKGALLIVSHDRYFLDRLCTSIAEIEQGRLTRYKGNYSAFVSQKEMAVQRQWKEYEQQQAEIAKLQEYVDKNLVRASTTAMAQSRRRQLEKMVLIEKPLSPQKTAKLRFNFTVQPPEEVLNVEGLELTVGKGEHKKVLAQNLEFTIRRGDKIAILGANGVGKTTLLRVLLGTHTRERGRVEWAKNVKISYFDQENAQLGRGVTVIDELHNRYPSMTDLAVRSALGAVRLTGENVFKPVSVISGGEKAKLCFALMMQENGNILVMDEPTNHLDMATKEVLEEALAAYEGTLLFVSHDRYLAEKVATNILELTPMGAAIYQGGFDSYLEIKRRSESQKQQREDKERQERKAEESAQKTAKLYRSKEQRAADAKRRQQIKAIEEEINALQEEVEALTERISLPEVCADYQLHGELCWDLEEKKNLVNQKTDLWFQLSDESLQGL